MAKRKIKTIDFGEIQVSKKAYDGLSKKANITNLAIENGKMHISYESKSGKVKGKMILNNIKTEE